jgi:hypothetical protein
MLIWGAGGQGDPSDSNNRSGMVRPAFAQLSHTRYTVTAWDLHLRVERSVVTLHLRSQATA